MIIFYKVDIALELGHKDALKMLLGKGGRPLIPASSTRIMDFAKLYNFPDVARKALRAAIVFAVSGERGKSADAVDILRAAVSHVTDVDFNDTDGRSPLFCAVRSGQSLAMVKLLLEAKADPNKCDHSGMPLCVYPMLRTHQPLAMQVLDLLRQYGLRGDLPIGDGGETVYSFALTLAPRVADDFKK